MVIASIIKQAKEKGQLLNKEEETIKKENPIIQKEEKTIKEITKLKEEKQPTQMELELEEEPKKFKNSEIISPIFGIQGTPSYQKSTIIEKPAPPKHAYDEMKAVYEQKDNNDFLNSLKEFRKNL